MKSKHFAVIVGARPNFIKAAPLFRRVKEFPHISFTLIHTGQHYDENMSRVFFTEMGIPRPDIQLGSSDGGTSLGTMIGQLREILTTTEYAGVIVFGDIDSTLAGALAARSAGLPVIHIEAGLRSNDKRMPEEKNRIIVDHCSEILFTTEPVAKRNLLAEGISEEKIFEVGNIMIESAELFRKVVQESDILHTLDLKEGRHIVATIHRAENTDDRHIFAKILGALGVLGETHQVILPLHPGTRAKIERYGLEDALRTVRIIEPLGYIEFMKLVSGSLGVVTDSGGIQEETTHLGIPCATLRDTTERPITVERGTNKLFPLATLEASEVREHLLKNEEARQPIPLWDGEVSLRILEVLNTLGE